MKCSITQRMIALILILGLLLPIAADATAGKLNVAQDANENTKGVISSDESASIIQAASIEELTKDSQILKHIDKEVLIANQHVARLPEEETLSSYAFLNCDGTMTVYYLDKAVKYMDESGKTVEKDISVLNTTGGFATATNNIGLLLPNDPATGINLSYGDYRITLVPEGGALSKTAQNNAGSVIYPNYFGKGMSLMYTPTLDGIKEDIVLTQYAGVTTFVFRLFTDGLRIYQENNRYYLAQSANAKVRIDMGDVVAFDARGRFSVGSMAIETVEMGQEYVLTLSVDEAFLTDENTVYPVSVDPTLTVSDNTHGAGAIEDITLYSGAPNANCDWPYLHCGYYDSTYKIARTMFRLSGLLSSSEYHSAAASEIASVKFYIKEATGTAALPVYIHANTGSATWTETGATWNNSGCQVGTRYATASPGVNQVAAYDITDLVKAWKNNTESAQAGFVLVSSNETTKDKAFYSSEATNSSNRSYVVLNYEVATNFDNAIAPTPRTAAPVIIQNPGEKRYFYYTPAATGYYTIESTSNTGDPMVWLYNLNCSELEVNDDKFLGSGVEFSLTYHLIANVTYYIVAGYDGQEIGSYTMSVSLADLADEPAYYCGIAGNGYTVNTTKPYEAFSYKITVSTTGTYFFKSSMENGDAKIWIYTSNYTLLTYDDNSGGNGKFSCEVYLTKGIDYYVAVAHTGSAVGTYGFALLMPITIPNTNDYSHLQNIGTEYYLDIHGPVEQIFAHQWSLHKDNQGKWDINQRTDGYYTIRSRYGQEYYLGVNSTNVGQNNVVLLSSVTDSALWKIYRTSDGSLWIEPKMASGKVLYVPNSNEGTELQLCWMSSAVEKRHTWKITAQWNVQPEGQQMEKWCWAAATRVLCEYYGDVPDARTQESMVIRVKGEFKDEGGNIDEIASAANYYSSGFTHQNPHFFMSWDGDILKEEALRRYLDDGHIVLIGRGWYKANNVRESGHAYVVTGYTTIVVEGQLVSMYTVFDPCPDNKPDPWDIPQVTEGQWHVKSYAWLCNGRNAITEDLGADRGIWTLYMAIGTSSFFERSSIVWNE